jgi:hypothetical protein
MDILPNVAQAKSINTTGLIKGMWNRIDAKETLFVSDTHPDYTLKFETAYTVIVTQAGNGNSHCYYWDPKAGELAEKAPLKWEYSLSVDVLSTNTKETMESKSENSKESSTSMEKEIKTLRTKIDDLTKQVESLQFICSNQERDLVAYTYGGERRRADPKTGRKIDRRSEPVLGNKPPSQLLKIPPDQAPMPPPPGYPFYQYPIGYPHDDHMYLQPWRPPFGPPTYPAHPGYEAYYGHPDPRHLPHLPPNEALVYGHPPGHQGIEPRIAQPIPPHAPDLAIPRIEALQRPNHGAPLHQNHLPPPNKYKYQNQKEHEISVPQRAGDSTEVIKNHPPIAPRQQLPQQAQGAQNSGVDKRKNYNMDEPLMVKPDEYSNVRSNNPYVNVVRPIHEEAKEEHQKASGGRRGTRGSPYKNVEAQPPPLRVVEGSLSKQPSRPRDIRSKTTVDRCLNMFMSQRNIQKKG